MLLSPDESVNEAEAPLSIRRQTRKKGDEKKDDGGKEEREMEEKKEEKVDVVVGGGEVKMKEREEEKSRGVNGYRKRNEPPRLADFYLPQRQCFFIPTSCYSLLPPVASHFLGFRGELMRYNSGKRGFYFAPFSFHTPGQKNILSRCTSSPSKRKESGAAAGKSSGKAFSFNLWNSWETKAGKAASAATTIAAATTLPTLSDATPFGGVSSSSVETCAKSSLDSIDGDMEKHPPSTESDGSTVVVTAQEDSEEPEKGGVTLSSVTLSLDDYEG